MDLEKLGKNIQALWKLITGHVAPEYVIKVAAAIAAVLAVLFLVAKVIKEIRPLFYNPDERRRARLRRRFATHVRETIDRIDNAADWSEHKFAELEAEVEAEGRRRRGFLNFRREPTLRRERSLSRALRSSHERLILLEGDPGAGKSVALRHLAVVIARQAEKSRSTRSLVPLYINLKSIDRSSERAVDAQLIREHVIKTLTQANVSDVEDFVESEFSRGIEEGTWLFLFDSFDEIPDVLSATTADTSIREYGEAIAMFLTTFNQCRGIVASRYFRGPGSLGWPRFRILALSDDYRRRLIRRADLPAAVERELIGHIELAEPALAVTSRNPMFLGLLCQHMAKGNVFPENTHVVFEDYVDSRLRRDQEKLVRRFGVGSVQVREAAEQAAFCMAYHPTLGLSPARDALAAAMAQRGYVGNPSMMFDALEFIKLGRPEGGTVDATFTFAHRRFQEYFATCVVLDAPDIVTPEQLLTDARWRETAVVLLQTQSGQRLNTIVAKLHELLQREVSAIEAEMPDATELITNEAGKAAADYSPRRVREFPWPELALHLLSLLQSGYQGRAAAAPHGLREPAGRIVLLATLAGTMTDRKWALEVAGISPELILVQAIREAFIGGSRWLAEVAYRQVALLAAVPDDIARPIRWELMKSFATGQLRREREATLAHLRRLPHNENYTRAARLLLATLWIDMVLHGCLFALLMRYSVGPAALGAAAVAVIISELSVRAALWVWSRPGADAGAGIAAFYLSIAGRSLPVVLLFLTQADHLTIVVAVILASWIGFAFIVATAARFTAIAYWPFLHVFGSWLAMQKVTRTLLIVPWFEMLRRFAWLVAVYGLVAFVYFNPFDWPVVEKARAILKAAIEMIATIGFGGVVAWTIYERFADRRRWQRQIEHVRKFVNVGELESVLTSLKLTRRRVQFIERVRQESLLDATIENEAAIRRLAVDLENDHVKERRFDIDDTRTVRTVFRITLASTRFRVRNGHRLADMRLIDALNVLSEHLRTRRTSHLTG